MPRVTIPSFPGIGDRPPIILLVDDEPFNLDLLEQELDEWDLDIRTAYNGQEALERIQEEAPDMIFLDLMMPIMDGFGVLEKLGEDEHWRDIPVVIVSANSDLEQVTRGIEMGAVDFLPKPFEPAILHARLISALEKKHIRDLEHNYLHSLERELEIGREIQADFLPTEIPQPSGWTIHSYFHAAREVAGDFYDVFEIEDGKLGLLLGDVTDKGVGSAMYMALYRSLLRAMVMAEELAGDDGGTICDAPEDCILRSARLVNSYICRLHANAMFATIFFGVLDTESGRICYLNAGHDPPFRLGNGRIVDQVMPTGPVLGVFDEAEFGIETFVIEPGESLVLYSDGIPDAQNDVGEMLGSDGFQALLEGEGRTASEIFESVLDAVDSHMGDAGQFDDITLVMVSRD